MPSEEYRNHEWRLSALYKNESIVHPEKRDERVRFVAVEICECFHLWELGMCQAIRFTKFGIDQVFPGKPVSYSGKSADKPKIRDHVQETHILLDGSEDWMIRAIDTPAFIQVDRDRAWEKFNQSKIKNAKRLEQVCHASTIQLGR